MRVIDGLRVGCVRYLNARPLIETVRSTLRLDHPAELAKLFTAGEIDVALMPTFHLLRNPEHLVVREVAIASNGPVFSVFVAHRKPLDSIRLIAADPASLTSVNLLRCLLDPLRTSLIPPDQGGVEPEALLLIGDQALEFREMASADWQFWDLGEEWHRRYKLPFVYAAWMIRSDLPNAEEVAEELREIKGESIRAIDAIAAEQTLIPMATCQRYLRDNIRYDLGELEQQGMQTFRELLEKQKLLPVSQQELHFV